jgi:ElaB/YqjD/DUF883 family membrane-anchored ribosome-binding protein
MNTTATTPTAAEQTARERLALNLQQMVDDAEQLLKNAQRTGSDQFTAARDKFESQLRNAKAELARLEDNAMYNAKRAARATDTAVHDHPYAAMGIAAGAGLLIGMLIARR